MALDERGRNERGDIIDWGKFNAAQWADRAHADNVVRAAGQTPPSQQPSGSAAQQAANLAGVPTQSPTGDRGWNNIAPPVKDAATGQVLAVNPQTGRYEYVQSPADYSRFGINSNESNVTVVPNAAGLAGSAPGGAPAGGQPGGAPGAPSAPGGVTPEQTFLGNLAAAGADAQANNFMVAAAQQKALQAYYEGQVKYQNDNLAFQRAQEAFDQEMERLKLEFDRQKETARVAEALRAFGLSEAGITGTYQGAPTEARLKREQEGALSALNLASEQRGPQNYFNYLKTFGNAPAGLIDVINSVAGRYNLGTAVGATGQGSPPATLQGLIESLQPANIAAQQAAVAGATRGLPAPNQIHLQNFGRLLPSQQQMVIGAYEAGLGPGGNAYTPEDVTRLIAQAAPQFVGPTSGRFTFG